MSFFVLEIFTILYYANEGSDDVIDRFTKTAAGPVSIKTKISRFHLTQGSSTPNNLMGRVKQCGNHVCSQEDPLSHSKRLQMGIFGFTQKETGNRGVAMATI